MESSNGLAVGQIVFRNVLQRQYGHVDWRAGNIRRCENTAQLTYSLLRPVLREPDGPGTLCSGFERGKGLFNRGGHLRRIRSDFGFEASDDAAVRPDEELGEIPLNLAAGLRVRGFIGQELVERCYVVALDGNLGHHRKGDVIFGGAERFDFLIRTRLLGAKVIRGDAHDDETPVFVLFIGGLQRGVLRSEAALAGDVDEQRDFAFVGRQWRGLSINGIQSEVMDRLFGSHERGGAEKHAKQ